MDQQLYVPVNTFRTRKDGWHMKDNYFALIYRERLRLLTLFIAHDPLTLDYHLESDPNLSGKTLAKGTLNPSHMIWPELSAPMTEDAIPELLRRAFHACFVNEFHLEEFFEAKVILPSRRFDLSIANIIGKKIIGQTLH